MVLAVTTSRKAGRTDSNRLYRRVQPQGQPGAYCGLRARLHCAPSAPYGSGQDRYGAASRSPFGFHGVLSASARAPLETTVILLIKEARHG